MADCTARIRPMRPVNDTEIACELGDHAAATHSGTLRNYAYEGSETVVNWMDNDRRNFRGEWPGACTVGVGCILPAGHGGNCAD